MQKEIEESNESPHSHDPSSTAMNSWLISSTLHALPAACMILKHILGLKVWSMGSWGSLRPFPGNCEDIFVFMTLLRHHLPVTLY